MEDFNLSDALDTPSEDQTLPFCGITADTKDADSGHNLHFIISCDGRTLQRVATLMVAINRLKKPLPSLSRLDDEQLCSAVLENLVEDRYEVLMGSRGSRTYQRVDSINECTLSDQEQKDLIQASGTMKLHAITLNGGNYTQKVKFQMRRYIFSDTCAVRGQPVVLSITNSLHLACTMEEGMATLNLETFKENELQRISSEKSMDRFLFYKSCTFSLTEFESVRYPGWFISTTSMDEDQPVEMIQADSAAASGRVTCFSMNRS